MSGGETFSGYSGSVWCGILEAKWKPRQRVRLTYNSDIAKTDDVLKDRWGIEVFLLIRLEIVDVLMESRTFQGFRPPPQGGVVWQNNYM